MIRIFTPQQAELAVFNTRQDPSSQKLPLNDAKKLPQRVKDITITTLLIIFTRKVYAVFSSIIVSQKNLH